MSLAPYCRSSAPQFPSAQIPSIVFSPSCSWGDYTVPIINPHKMRSIKFSAESGRDLGRQLVSASFGRDTHAEVCEAVGREPFFVEFSCACGVAREGTFRGAAAILDAPPAQFVGRVEPDRAAVARGDECAVALKRPRAAARGDDARRARFKLAPQGARLGLAEVGFALGIYQLAGPAPFHLGHGVVEVEEGDAEQTRERAPHGRLARAHEARDDDASAGLHLSVTDSSSGKNSGKETATHSSAPSISVSPSAASAATAKAIAMRWSP